MKSLGANSGSKASPQAPAGLGPAGYDPGRVDKLLHPRTGVLRGIFGADMPAGKGGPDPDNKLLHITVGELREIDGALREQRAMIERLKGTVQ